MKLSETFWNTKYKDQKTGWDLGVISPPLKAYFDQIENKELKILITGGGNSYEAEYLFSKGFENVFVLDISKIALENIKKRVPNFPTTQLLHANFFEIEDSFDLVIEQTFFCAIDPSLRLQYAQKMESILTPKGKIVGLLFEAVLNEDHPPFGGTKEEYLTYFQPYFQIVKMDPCYNSYPNRQGMELFVQLIKK
ncbi:methyltransferase domain-containing protein [Polaribacter sp. HL-MS24]|uniref:methyltransferase domain-containing protein n=1 Tax=Polaribacter sp. HL-MS24 TaxID=3077735 RepID=UPI00293476D6|nr:methyltransferase domain-containing protein [Polaribacter sp. HL-MS24]WOC39233.1 methyltransferase domain-containing protein [Polaribacter sp. HL-MS24]